MTILPKAIYGFNTIPIKLLMTFFIELEQIILKFIWNHKRPRIAKAILRKKEEIRRHSSPRLQMILQSYSIQNSMILAQKDTYINRTEQRAQKLTHTLMANLQQRRQEYIMKKRQSLQQAMQGIDEGRTYKLMKVKHSLKPYTKISSKWLKDLNIRHDTIKLLEENIHKTF